MVLNFKIIEFEPRLSDLYSVCQKAQNYLDSDPDASCTNSRIALEEIVRIIIDEEGCRVSPQTNLNDKINLLKNKRIISSKSMNWMHTIRDFGNKSAHNANSHNTQYEAHKALECLFCLINENLRKYNFQIKRYSTFWEKNFTQKIPVYIFVYLIPFLMVVGLCFVSLWTLVFTAPFLISYEYNKFRDVSEIREWNEARKLGDASPEPTSGNVGLCWSGLASFLFLTFYIYSWHSWYYVLGFLLFLIICPMTFDPHEHERKYKLHPDIVLHIIYVVLLNLATVVADISLLPYTLIWSLLTLVSVILRYKFLM